MKLITWSEALSVGVERIDEQHKRLLQMVQALADAQGRDHGDCGVSPEALRELCDYAVEHFATEEALMDMDAYPEYDQHVTQHLECTTKALEFLETCAEGGSVDILEFLEFLAEWVTTHICQVDQTLARYLRQSGNPLA